jgi:hypothetical protein
VTGGSAYVQVVLEGVALPAKRDELLEYAGRQGAEPWVVQELRRLPDREFRSLDEVGEALAPVQPSPDEPAAKRPAAESGAPPGGDAYVSPRSLG